MRTASITVRFYQKSFLKIKKVFPPLRGESMPSYFERLSKWLEQVQAEWSGYQ